jgi:hypothetical protein
MNALRARCRLTEMLVSALSGNLRKSAIDHRDCWQKTSSHPILPLLRREDPKAIARTPPRQPKPLPTFLSAERSLGSRGDRNTLPR